MPRRDVLRVAVDVTPRLFRDALTRVLTDNDIEVVIVPDELSELPNVDCDFVVTSKGRRVLYADRTVEVAPNTGHVDTPSLRAVPSDGSRTEPDVRNLDHLLEVLRSIGHETAS